MMESERSHRSGSTSSELFICFTARPSSSSASSIKISSKSILSPGCADKFREPTLSLSSSLSRRLRSNGSMKSGQSSPMFPTGNKKKGSAFEPTEPSSPKVTCIGQVRVKTKKQRTKRGEVSFRKTEQIQEGIHQQQQYHHHQDRNQRWVHIPLTICEALRAFGAEFNCFLPCRSSCSSPSEREKGEKTRTNPAANHTSSCVTVFGRWLMALQEGEEEKRREVELVAGEEQRREKKEVVDVIEIEEREETKEEIEEEEARVSICIPPRNALLLMRCRSDPVRMSSLANRFWDSPAPKEEDDDNEDEDGEEEAKDPSDEEEGGKEKVEEDEGEGEVKVELDEKYREEEMVENWVSAQAFGVPNNPQNENNSEMEENPPVAEEAEVGGEENPDREEEESIDKQKEQQVEQEAVTVNVSSPEALEDSEKPEVEGKDEEQESNLQDIVEEAEEDGMRASSFSSTSAVTVQPEKEEEQQPESETTGLATTASVGNDERSIEKIETEQKSSEDEIETQYRSATEQHHQNQNHDLQHEDALEKSEEREGSLLPDCLLLMMCEPKLSMEVSKETWVSSTDYIRRRPEKQILSKDGGDELKNRVNTDTNPPQLHRQQQTHQPARKSYSNPVPTSASMATMIEQKLVNAAAYEPFVLTRCKSEPMRSSAKLAPDACFWKDRKLEPHRPATLGVGAAGMGF